MLYAIRQSISISLAYWPGTTLHNRSRSTISALKVISENKLDLGQLLFTWESPNFVFKSFGAFALDLIWGLKQ